MNKILLIEDDTRLTEHISKLLQTEGMNLTAVSTETELESTLAGKEVFQVILMDRLLGNFDMKSKVSDVKRKWSQTPILVLSAINTPIERADLLNLGVDDYMGKPFLSQELLARVKALSRRFSVVPQNYRQMGNTVMDLSKRILSVEDRSEALPPKEFLLFKLLSDDMGRVINRGELLDAVWGNNSATETNVVEATVTNLRKRLQHLGSDLEIKNMRNAGYWLEE
jgi:Response regulators consisting of a CheY-like receiver domain and a winged-helix DNA-binding domain